MYFCSAFSLFGAGLSISIGGEAILELLEDGVDFVFAEALILLYIGILLMAAGSFGLFFVTKWKRRSKQVVQSRGFDRA
jgi:hypothetical protein